MLSCSLLVCCSVHLAGMMCVVNLYIRLLVCRTPHTHLVFPWFVSFRNCIHSLFSIKKTRPHAHVNRTRKMETHRAMRDEQNDVLLPLLDMSHIKKFFAKVKSEVKFAKAGEGHRLNDPTPTTAPRGAQAPPRPQGTARQTSDGGAAARAAAEAAQQRFQQQTSRQQSATTSTSKTPACRRRSIVVF